jgi:hypothetical protein
MCRQKVRRAPTRAPSKRQGLGNVAQLADRCFSPPGAARTPASHQDKQATRSNHPKQRLDDVAVPSLFSPSKEDRHREQVPDLEQTKEQERTLLRCRSLREQTRLMPLSDAHASESGRNVYKPKGAQGMPCTTRL